MRDIRCDLQERANVVEEQIRAIYAHFEKVVQQLQSERDARVAELQGTHMIINQLLEFEAAFMGNVVLWKIRKPRSDRIKAVSGLQLSAEQTSHRRASDIHPSSRALSLAACHARGSSAWSTVSVRRLRISWGASDDFA
jgi:hypothetical protein